MKIHVLSIGDEILRGHTLNTNLAYVGRMLDANGLSLAGETCVPDDLGAIVSALERASVSADLILTIGGLGPTCDDLTRDAAARFLGRSLYLDEKVAATVVSFLERCGVTNPDEAVQRQAMVIADAEIIPNSCGTAPGMWCRDKRVAIALLPGPPSEFCTMFREHLLPRLLENASPGYCSRTFIVSGIPESHVARTMAPILARTPGPSVAYCAKPGEIHVQLRTRPGEGAVLDGMVAQARASFGHAMLPDGCLGLAEAVGELLTVAGLQIGTAESCTGGGIAAALTDVPGSSGYLQGAFVTYSNQWKMDRLHVNPRTLEAHGAVSRQVAGEMLNGLLAYDGVIVGIAVTGIAGPGGGSTEKPVGLVYIATGTSGKTRVTRNLFPGNRAAVRERTVKTALNQVREDLLDLALDSSKEIPCS